MKIKLEKDAVVVFQGAMGTGKSTFAKKKFATHDVISSDDIRESLTGDFEDQTVNKETFKILYFTAEVRIESGILTVVDSTGSIGLINEIRNMAVKHKRPLYLFRFPHLTGDQITPERMKHRMKYLHAYHSQVARIDRTNLPKEYVVVDAVDDLIVEFDTEATNELNPEFDYVVVPDLHGEHSVLQLAIDNLKPNQKIIQLGDIVDRGPSGYETFKLMKKGIEDGVIFGVVSNHDDKFYRYLKKYRKDPLQIVDGEVPNYGMKLAHGLTGTVTEMLNLPDQERISYVNDFIEYYESLPYFLKLRKDGVTHYFAHAGINPSIIVGRHIGNVEISSVKYGPNVKVEEISELTPEVTTVHIGHLFEQDVYAVEEHDENRVIQHDVGLGKRELKNESDKAGIVSRFYVIGTQS